MGGGVLIYAILLMVVSMIHGLYFDEPLSRLWFRDDYSSFDIAVNDPGDGWSILQWEWGAIWLGLGQFERDVVVGAVLGLLFVGLSRLISARFLWAKRIDDDFAPFFREQSSLSLTLLALSSSLAEEIIFRGWLQNLIGFIAASVIFGLLHMPPKREHWPWTLSALTMGFVLGGVYEWRGAVTAPFITHFTINYFNLHALARRPLTSVSRGEEQL